MIQIIGMNYLIQIIEMNLIQIEMNYLIQIIGMNYLHFIIQINFRSTFDPFTVAR